MYVIGVDIGTSGTKALLLNESGKIEKSAYKAYGLSCPRDLFFEQDALAWLDAVVCTVREILPDNVSEVTALSFSTQGGSTLAIDRTNNPLTPAITWMDKRSGKQVKRLESLRPLAEWYKSTGTTPNPGYSIAHISWIREEEPEMFKSAARFVTTLDFINLRLTGNCVIDSTNALMTGIFNIEKNAWDDFSLNAAGVSAARLAVLKPTGAPVGTLTEKAANLLGLHKSVIVFNGAHDQYSTSVGCGAVRPNDFLISGGTAWVLLGSFDHIVSDSTMTLTPGRHIIPGMYGAFYSTSIGGSALNSFLDQNGFSRSDFPDVDRVASERIFKNAELKFYPYFNDTTDMYKNPNVNKVFVGLTQDTDRYDMALSIMEAIAFEAARAIALFEENGCAVSALRMRGGAAKSELWANILAAVTGRSVIRSDMTEAACLGAAIIAGVSSGMFHSYQTAVAQCCVGENTLIPDAKLREFYLEKFKQYLEKHPGSVQFSR